MKTLSSDVCGHEDRVDVLVCTCGHSHVLLRSSCRITGHLSLSLRTHSLYLLLFGYSLIYCYSCCSLCISCFYVIFCSFYDVGFVSMPPLSSQPRLYVHASPVSRLCVHVSMSQCQVCVFVNVSCIFDSLACSVSVFAFASMSQVSSFLSV